MEHHSVNSLQFDPQSTALVLIDLQNGIMGRTLAPHASSDVVAHGAQLAAALRAKGGTVVYVRVDMSSSLSKTPCPASKRKYMTSRYRIFSPAWAGCARWNK
jgi:nicotinamidase-related amidase